MGVRLSEEKKKEPTSLPLVFAWAFTAFWVLAVAAYLATRGGLQAIRNLKPDAFGDFFAGISAPLAFLWLVVATILQRKELEQNREALLLQAQELKASVEQLTQQTQIFSATRNAELGKSIEEEIERKLDRLAEFVLARFREIEVLTTASGVNTQQLSLWNDSHENVRRMLDNKNYDEAIRLSQRSLRHFRDALSNPALAGQSRRRGKNLTVLEDALARVENIIKLAKCVEGSPAEVRVMGVELSAIEVLLKDTLELLRLLPTE